ncbi:MAG: Thiamin ABC transporter, transmembrane component [uncultured Nocardioidaceae bacterium]|uniref:Thiamin ABC transporter, transmembrane component n=1 Tax=uncultured Nocardioidaceae bacterium TaxID=253824 RepID=A0A6J4KUZ7_9ACTN|nr:MAG: Thiamin ABC transporter, transmembrane component [uncultured Nocardioidaceae bacterium]
MPARRRAEGIAWPLAVTVAAAVPLCFLGLFFAWPVGSILRLGLVSDGSLDLSGFGEVFGRPRTWRIIGQTLAQSGTATAITVLLGLPGAHLLYRCRFRGRGVVRVLVTVPFVLPTVVVGVAFRNLLVEGGLLEDLGADGTFAAVVAALVFFNYAVVVRTVGSMWAHLDPRPEQAARALGASPWQAFVSVTLPSLWPAVASAASLVFLFCATSFGTVLVLGGPGYGTVETEIWLQTTQYLDLRSAAVLSLVQLAVVVVSLYLASRSRRRREAALRLRVESSVDRPLQAADAPVIGLTATVVLGLLVTPLVSLLLGSLRVEERWTLDNYRNLASTGSDGLFEVSVWEAALNSVRIAVDATWMALLVGGLACVVLTRRPRTAWGQRALSVFDGLFMLPLGVSAVTVGFGLLVALSLGPLDLRDSILLVPVAQAVVAVPLVVRTLLPVLRAVDQRLREAAAVLGAGPARVFWAVDVPVLGRSLGLSVGFAFAVSLGEFGATSFLARPERPTLPVVIARLIGRPGAESLGMALAASTVLAVATTLVIALAELVRLHTAEADL